MTSIRIVNNNPMSRLHSILYYLKKKDRISKIADGTASTGHYINNR